MASKMLLLIFTVVLVIAIATAENLEDDENVYVDLEGRGRTGKSISEQRKDQHEISEDGDVLQNGISEDGEAPLLIGQHPEISEDGGGRTREGQTVVANRRDQHGILEDGEVLKNRILEQAEAPLFVGQHDEISEDGGRGRTGKSVSEQRKDQHEILEDGDVLQNGISEDGEAPLLIGQHPEISEDGRGRTREGQTIAANRDQHGILEDGEVLQNGILEQAEAPLFVGQHDGISEDGEAPLFIGQHREISEDGGEQNNIRIIRLHQPSLDSEKNSQPLSQ